MGYSYDYNLIDSTLNNLIDSTLSTSYTWIVVALVLSIIGGILVYFLFLKRENENKFTGFLKYLYEFLSFKKMWLETILKVSYLILVIYVTLSSFELISVSFISFILVLIFGNIFLRVIYELALLLLTICRNTIEINKKLK